jgi:hypothetical protein
MVNRPLIRGLFEGLCKTFVATALCVAAPHFSYAQIDASASAPADAAKASFGAPAEKLKIAGVPNAGKISDTLFRGAQPSEKGLAELKKLGVTTIVDLRGNRGPVARERVRAEALGMHFIDIPVSGMSPPSNSQSRNF